MESIKAMNPALTVVSVGELKAKDDASASYERFSRVGCYSTLDHGDIIARCYVDGESVYTNGTGRKLRALGTKPSYILANTSLNVLKITGTYWRRATQARIARQIACQRVPKTPAQTQRAARLEAALGPSFGFRLGLVTISTLNSRMFAAESFPSLPNPGRANATLRPSPLAPRGQDVFQL